MGMRIIQQVLLFLFVTCDLLTIAQAQEPMAIEKPSPYKTSFKTDGPIIAAGLGLTYLGYSLVVNKKGITPAELATKKKENIPFFDRGNVGFYSEQADKDSYIPFQASFAMPVIMLLANKNERQHAGQIAALYVEAMSISASLFTLSAGLVERSRPLVYGSSAPLETKLINNSQRSFFAGHVSATATATFFAAKVFQDFNPDSKARPYVWAAAAAIPAVVGYLRYKAGMHFLSDNILGYAIGMGCGILVPQLHKTNTFKNLSIVPQAGDDYKGLALLYRFK
jgi:membrane-associated phospholipid phosphatase